MARQSSSINEGAAIDAIKAAFRKTQIISADNLKTGDKFLCWDGDIEIYKDKTHKKDGVRLIRTQVKSKSSKDLNKNDIKHPVKTADIEAYKDDGGIIYFVVYVDSKHNTQIYYTILLPFDCVDIIGKSGGKKKTSLIFNKFPTDPERIRHICLTFLQDKDKQGGFKESQRILSLEELKEANFTDLSLGCVSSQKLLFDFLFNNDTYSYATNKITRTSYPFAKGRITVIEDNHRYSLSCEQKVYPQKLYFRDIKEFREMKVGKSFLWELNRDETKPSKFTFSLNGTLPEAVDDLALLIDLLDGKTVMVDELSAPLNLESLQIEHGDSLSSQKELLEILIKWRDVAEYCKIADKIYFAPLSKEDTQIIDVLYQGLVELKPVTMPSHIKENATLLNTHIGDVIVKICLTRQEDGKYKIFDFMNDNSLEFAVSNEEKKNVPASRFIFLKKEDFLKMPYLDLNYAVEDILSQVIWDPILERTGLTSLEMIAAYDEDNSRSDLLEAADKLQNYITNKEETALEYMQRGSLNKIQIMKRLGTMGEKELITLNDILSNPSNDLIKIGCYILLDNSLCAKELLSKMPKKEREYFMKFPMGNLLKKKDKKKTSKQSSTNT